MSYLLKEHLLSFLLITGSLTLCILGAHTFGSGLNFGYISAIGYVVIGMWFREEKNIFGVCIALSLLQLSSNLLFLITFDHPGWALLGYSLSIFVTWKFIYDLFAKLLLALILFAIVFEVYWLITAYTGPEIYFYFIKASILLVARQYLIVRPFSPIKFHTSKPVPIRADWLIYKAIELSILVESLMICEYLIRHLTTFQPMFVYNYYTYLMNGLSVYWFWIISTQASLLLSKQLLKA